MQRHPQSGERIPGKTGFDGGEELALLEADVVVQLARHVRGRLRTGLSWRCQLSDQTTQPHVLHQCLDDQRVVVSAHSRELR
jgi:hypothetical protein